MRTRLARAVATLAAAALVGGSAPATAATVAGVATGSGTIVPGLTDVPTDQHVDFVLDIGLGTDTDGNSVVASGCRFVADGFDETVSSGQGFGTVSVCATGSVSGLFHYERIFSFVFVGGSFTMNGRTYDVAVNCSFEPTSVAPVRSYVLQCVVGTS